MNEDIDWNKFLVSAEKLEYKKVDTKNGDIFLCRIVPTWEDVHTPRITVRAKSGQTMASCLAGNASGGWDTRYVHMIRYADGRWAEGFDENGPIAAEPAIPTTPPTTEEGWKALLPKCDLPKVETPVNYPEGTIIAESSFGSASIILVGKKTGRSYESKILAASSASYCTPTFDDTSTLAEHSKVLYPAPAKEQVSKKPSAYVPSDTYDGPINSRAVFCRRDNPDETIQVNNFDRRAAKVNFWDGPCDLKTTNVKRFRRVYVPVRPTTEEGWKLLYPTGHHFRENNELLDYPVGTIIGVRCGEDDERPRILAITKKEGVRFFVDTICGPTDGFLTVKSFVEGSNWHHYSVVLFEAPPPTVVSLGYEMENPLDYTGVQVGPDKDSIMGAAVTLVKAFAKYREIVANGDWPLGMKIWDAGTDASLKITGTKTKNPKVTIEMAFVLDKDPT